MNVGLLLVLIDFVVFDIFEFFDELLWMEMVLFMFEGWLGCIFIVEGCCILVVGLILYCNLLLDVNGFL